MREPLPEGFRRLLREQDGLFRMAQARSAGLSRGAVQANIAAGRWRRLGSGVLIAHNGPLDGITNLWYAVLCHQPGAVLSHQTAGYLQDFLAQPPSLVHICVPVDRRLPARRGVVLHRTRRALNMAPGRNPPQTAPASTLLDLIECADTPANVVALVTRCFQRRLATPAQVKDTLASRRRMRWRALLTELLSDATDGVESALEWRFDRDVVIAHGLPEPVRQDRAVRGGRRIRRDRVFARFRVVVELDGRLGHDGEAVFRDMHRDNAAAVAGEMTLRYGWVDVVGRPCTAAAQIAVVLRKAGWRGRLKPCPRCGGA